MNFKICSLLFSSLFLFGATLVAETLSTSPPSSNKVEACVVTPAPDVTWLENGKLTHLSSLRGKPVLLLIALSPTSWAFRSQLSELKGMYSRLANRELICIAAFTQQEGVIPSNIPFITANNGPAVAAAYDVKKDFASALISSDGNLDCLSTKVLPGQRIDDLIDASFATQARLRRE